MRLANHGYTALEIAEELELPEEFSSQGHTTGYYGHLVHNVKAVYQRYLSWYDGNPQPLAPTSDRGGLSLCRPAGGADAMVAAAQKSFDEGDYRWVVEMLNHLVFAEPDHAAGRALQADALDNLATKVSRRHSGRVFDRSSRIAEWCATRSEKPCVAVFLMQ